MSATKLRTAAEPISSATYRRGVLLVAGSMLAWSSAGLFARLVATDPWTTLFWRSVFAAASLVLYLAVRNGSQTWAGFRRLGAAGWAMGACFAASMVCFINALAYTSVATVLVFQAAAPLFAAALAWMLLRESVSGHKLAAIAITMAAVLFIVMGSGAGQLAGSVLSAGMGVTYAATIVLARYRADVPTTEATVVGVVLVAMLTASFARFSVPLGEMAMLAGFGIVQMGLALVLFTDGVRLIPAADAGLISVLEAVLAPLWVWLAFGENPGWRTLAGGTVVLAAVVFTAWREARDRGSEGSGRTAEQVARTGRARRPG